MYQMVLKKRLSAPNLVFWLQHNLIPTICSCKSLIFQSLVNVSSAGFKHFIKKWWGQDLPSLRWGILIKLLLESDLNCTLLDPEKPPILWILLHVVWLWLAVTFSALPVFAVTSREGQQSSVNSNCLSVESRSSCFSCHTSFLSLSNTWAGGYRPVSPGFTCVPQRYTSAI